MRTMTLVVVGLTLTAATSVLSGCSSGGDTQAPLPGQPGAAALPQPKVPSAEKGSQPQDGKALAPPPPPIAAPSPPPAKK